MWDYSFLETLSLLHKVIQGRIPPRGGSRDPLGVMEMYIFMRVVILQERTYIKYNQFAHLRFVYLI